jgi:hypothetical protein
VSAAGGTATVFKADVAARAELRKLGLALSRCEEDAVVDKFVAKFDAWMASRTYSETLPDDD